jgi:hypothetical protein
VVIDRAQWVAALGAMHVVNRDVAGQPLVRRAVMASGAIVLVALAGLALPVAAGSTRAAATVVLDPTDGDRRSHDPRCREKPPCPTGQPTPTGTPTVSGTGPAPSPTPTAGEPVPGGSAGGAGGGPGPGPGGQSGPAGAPGQPDASGAAGGAADRVGTAPNQAPAGDVIPDGSAQAGTGPGSGSGGQAQPTGRTSLVAAARPFWPFLWGGTFVIAVITVGLLLTLRDKPNRPPATASTGPGQGSEQTVVSPREPIRMDWTEPPG